MLKTALTRGAFEYQGQKCSAASRAYIPALASGTPASRRSSPPRSTASPWATSPTCRNFIGAVIDERAFAKNKAAIDRAKADPSCDDRRGRHLRRLGRLLRAPDRLECSDPENEVFTTEYFGPILAVHVYEDERRTTRC